MSSSDVLLTAGLIAAAYLAGSIPFSFLVARARGVDLRKVGSGSIGGANVWRSSGFVPFLVAAALDILKGALPTYAATRLLPGQPWAAVLAGLAAILGHTFSIFLKFKGGKAVATSGGVLLVIAPILIPFGIVAWVIGFLISRMSSVGSLAAAAVVLIAGTALFLIGRLPLPYALFVWLAVGFVVYLHRTNIQRLIAGTENRFGKLW
ncbi:MAG TPA: glycerol-3-phosphate 1-O-acyltransferase PlsY [Roseiflexaceae bacterium]